MVANAVVVPFPDPPQKT